MREKANESIWNEVVRMHCEGEALWFQSLGHFKLTSESNNHSYYARLIKRREAYCLNFNVANVLLYDVEDIASIITPRRLFR